MTPLRVGGLPSLESLLVWWAVPSCFCTSKPGLRLSTKPDYQAPCTMSERNSVPGQPYHTSPDPTPGHFNVPIVWFSAERHGRSEAPTDDAWGAAAAPYGIAWAAAHPLRGVRTMGAGSIWRQVASEQDAKSIAQVTLAVKTNDVRPQVSVLPSYPCSLYRILVLMSNECAVGVRVLSRSPSSAAAPTRSR